jgi:plasmid stabilization system protein ParE
MRIVYSTLARQELEDAARYYELEHEGLGERFRQEVKKATRRITRYPQAWSLERGEVRKCLLHKFPYKLLYSIETDHIFVIAVAHQHRRPDYWVGG